MIPNRSSKKRSEEELVLALKNRDASAFNYLIKNYSYALRKAIDRPNISSFSDDLLQDTFIKVWEKIDSYDATKGRLFSWMVTIARNIVSHLTASKNHKKAQLTAAMDEYIDVHPYLLDQDNYLNTNCDMVNLLELAQKYAPAHIDIIRSYLQGYGYREIGKQHDLSISVVSKRIHKSLESIKRALNADFFYLGKPQISGNPGNAKLEKTVLYGQAELNPVKLNLGKQVKALKVKGHKMKYISKTLGVSITTCHVALRYLNESESSGTELPTLEEERIRIGKKVSRLRLNKLSMKAISKKLKISVSTCYSGLRYLDEVNESKRDYGAYLKKMREIARRVRESQQQGKSPEVAAKVIGVHADTCYNALRMFKTH